MPDQRPTIDYHTPRPPEESPRGIATGLFLAVGVLVLMSLLMLALELVRALMVD